MSKPGRIPCEVMACRRTAPAAKYPVGTRICCGKCWRIGRAEDRDAYRAAWRVARSAEGLGPAAWYALPVERRAEITAARESLSAAFDAVVATASEARAGIG